MGYPEVPLLAYADARRDIRSGDMLLCSGSSVFSRLIQHATESVWSHVGFILRLDTIERIMVLESVESIGVRACALSNYVTAYNGQTKGYPGRIFLARHQDFAGVPQERLASFSQGAIDLLGYPYDTQQIVGIAARIVAAKLGMASSPFSSNRSYICSEYAAACFHSIQIPIPSQHADFVTPDDFATCAAVEFLCELVVERLPQEGP